MMKFRKRKKKFSFLGLRPLVNTSTLLPSFFKKADLISAHHINFGKYIKIHKTIKVNHNLSIHTHLA